MTRDIDSYTSGYLGDYGFEREMVRYRHRMLMERLFIYKPKTIIEIGCGDEILAKSYYEHGGRWDSWLIVEPSSHFVESAKQAKLPNLSVVQGFFEEVQNQVPIRNQDMILCSGLLHEVPSAEHLIDAVAKAMGQHTILHANVPNAWSLHRRLAKSMGILDDLKALSIRNKTLDQRRVFDADSLVELLAAASLKIFERGGYLMKPFTHKQMEAAAPVLTREVLDGLYVLGQQHPEWSSEIFCEARLA